MEKSFWKNLRNILINYRWRFLKALLMVVIANGVAVFMPLVFRQAILQMDQTEPKPGGILYSFIKMILGAHVASLWAWAAFLLFLASISSFFKYRMRLAFITISRDAERDVRSQLFTRIQEQSMAFYDRHGIGELLSRLTNDISAYRDMLGPGVMYPMFFLTLVTPSLIALFSISPPLATISLFPLFAIPILNFLTRHSIYRASYDAQKGLADLSNMAQEHFSGIRIAKGYVSEFQLMRLFSRLGRSLIRINIKLNCYQGLLFPFFTFLTKMTTVFLVIVSALVIFKGWSTLNAADFVSFMWIQSYIFFPVLMLAWVLPVYARGRAAYDRLVEVYEEPVEVKDGTVTIHTIPPDSDIEFCHLTFAYPETGKPVLNDFCLHIRAGSFVGITGPVGAGKTTLFRILNREYEIPKGKVLIGGHDIHDYPLEAFGKEIVTVEQIPFLFSRTIAENVRFGKEEALLDEIEAVARYADLHDTVLEFPERYDTLIGERGVTLSGGQKQRVAMARAFLVNRSILLLDDVFSAVDTKTESRIFKAMKENFKNKTVLLITHRLSILEGMDRILYMEEGKIVEDGAPDELKGKNGKYAALLAMQKLQK